MHFTAQVWEHTFIRLHKSHDVLAFGRRAGEESRDSDSRLRFMVTEARCASVIWMAAHGAYMEETKACDESSDVKGIQAKPD
jgi:hypothetical protein